MIRTTLALALALGGGALALAPTPAAHAQEPRPTRPSNLAADPSGPGTISLSWSASASAVGLRGYLVFRDGSQIGEAANTEFTDRGLAPGRYTYSVAAVDKDGNVSRRSAPASATATR
jgi:chitodextrinase